MHNQQPWAKGSDKPCLVTYNPVSPIDERKILEKRSFRHIVHDVRHVAWLVNLFRFIQGRKGTWHCGAHTLINSQETCLVTGLAAARQLGADYPFDDPRGETVVQLLREHPVRPAVQEGVGREPSDVARIGIELGAVAPEGHDLAVGSGEARARSVLLAAPDDHVLENVVPLLGHHETCSTGGRAIAPAGTPSLRSSFAAWRTSRNLRDQRQVDELATSTGVRQHPQARIHARWKCSRISTNE